MSEKIKVLDDEGVNSLWKKIDSTYMDNESMGVIVQAINDEFEEIEEKIQQNSFSGDYNDLTNKPTVLTGGSQTSTSSADSGSNVYTFTKSDGGTSTLTVKNGSKGSTGASAYDIWKSLGNSGTEQDFINSLKAQDIDSLKINYITKATDLNTITTPGFYCCASSNIAGTSPNSPVSIAFFMIVGKHAGVYQELIEYRTANFRRYMRNFYSSTWSEWIKVYTSNDKPTAADIGFTASTTDIDNAAKGNYNVGTCGTAAATAAKTVTTLNTDFVLKIGVEVYIKFTSGSTVANPTLNVNSTGALPIVYSNNQSPVYLIGGINYRFQYTGASWLLVNVFDYNVLLSGRNYERYGFIFNGDTLKPIVSGYSPSLGANTSKINNIFVTNLGSADYPTDNIFATNIGSSSKKVNNIYADYIGGYNDKVGEMYVHNIGEPGNPSSYINTEYIELDTLSVKKLNRNYDVLLPITLVKGKFFIANRLTFQIPQEYVRIISSFNANTPSTNSCYTNVSYGSEGYTIVRLIGMDLKITSSNEVIARPFVLYATVCNYISNDTCACYSPCDGSNPNSTVVTTPQGYSITIEFTSLPITSGSINGNVNIGISAYYMIYFFQIDVL